MTLNGLADDPPISSRYIMTNPVTSSPMNWSCVKLTLISTQMVTTIHITSSQHF